MDYTISPYPADDSAPCPECGAHVEIGERSLDIYAPGADVGSPTITGLCSEACAEAEVARLKARVPVTVAEIRACGMGDIFADAVERAMSAWATGRISIIDLGEFLFYNDLA